jgi:hypothetical protein
MKTRKQRLTLDDAETIALQGLTFLVGDPQRLVRFLSLTGLTPQDLKGFSRDPNLQMALMDYLLGDESLLLVFTSEAGVSPEVIAPAYELLALAAGQTGRPET